MVKRARGDLISLARKIVLLPSRYALECINVERQQQHRREYAYYYILPCIEFMADIVVNLRPSACIILKWQNPVNASSMRIG